MQFSQTNFLSTPAQNYDFSIKFILQLNIFGQKAVKSKLKIYLNDAIEKKNHR